jgi:hypothetical protein
MMMATLGEDVPAFTVVVFEGGLDSTEVAGVGFALVSFAGAAASSSKFDFCFLVGKHIVS